MAEQTLEQWLDSLAAKQPTPGGGGAAALLAAISAALLGMVSIYTTGKKWQDREAEMLTLNKNASRLRAQALQLIDDDAKAFAKVGAAYSLPKEDDSRTNAIQKALIAAAEPPSHVTDLTIKLVDIAQKIADHGNPNVISDVAVATATTEAALQSAIVNIEINLKFIKNGQVQKDLQSKIAEAEQAITKAQQITEQVRKGISG